MLSLTAYGGVFYWFFLCLAWSLIVWKLLDLCEATSLAVEVSRDHAPLLLALAIVAARWPTIFVHAELNPDESQLFAGALGLMHDPVPWRGADNTTSGPLNSYVLIPLILLGLDSAYAAARIISVLLLIVSTSCWYLTVKAVRGSLVALSLSLPFVAWLCFVGAYDLLSTPDFAHYSSELLPIALLSVAVWTLNHFKRAPIAAPALGGFALGCVPFAKLQAAPLASFVSAALAVYILVKRRRHLGSLIALIACGAVMPLLIALPLLLTRTVEDAWRSYVISALDISVRPLSMSEFASYAVGFPSLNWAFAALAVIALGNFSTRYFRDRVLRHERVLLFGVTGYAIIAVLAISKAGNPWGHYLLFLLHPGILLAGVMSAPSGTATLWQRSLHAVANLIKRSKLSSLGLAFGFACSAALLLMFLIRAPEAVRLRLRHPDPIVRILEPIIRTDDHIAVWGYMPKYYALTRTRPSTREAITQFQAWNGPQQAYYRKRYMSDLRRQPPNVFVDASGEGNFSFIFEHHPQVRIEEFKELDEFIQEHYVLLLDIRPCETPETRVFVSRDRLNELGIGPDKLIEMPTCIDSAKALERTLRLLNRNGRID